jgi:hypothetical protein
MSKDPTTQTQSGMGVAARFGFWADVFDSAPSLSTPALMILGEATMRTLKRQAMLVDDLPAVSQGLKVAWI